MTRQILIPVSGIDDARVAIASLPQVSEPNDEVIVLAISRELSGELIGSRPSSLQPRPITGPGTNAGLPQPDDVPVFIGREEMMDRQSLEITEALADMTQHLRDGGANVRVESVFSDNPTEAILDYAREIDPAEICVTRAFQESLEFEDNEIFTRLLPGT